MTYLYFYGGDTTNNRICWEKVETSLADSPILFDLLARGHALAHASPGYLSDDEEVRRDYWSHYVGPWAKWKRITREEYEAFLRRA